MVKLKEDDPVATITFADGTSFKVAGGEHRPGFKQTLTEDGYIASEPDGTYNTTVEVDFGHEAPAGPLRLGLAALLINDVLVGHVDVTEVTHDNVAGEFYPVEKTSA